MFLLMKKLFRVNYRYDFGHDIYFQILNFNRWSLIQASFSYNDFPGWPYLQLTIGSNGLFGFLFWVWKLGISIDIFSITWNFEYLNELDVEEDETTT